MSGDLKIRCACGVLEGVVHEPSRRETNRVVCYCGDCQAYVHHLGRAADVLDAHGGTEIVQMSPARVEITSGAEQLNAIRLTSKGLFRWYAACCRTPVGNTLPIEALPFVGLVTACIEAGAGRDALDLALGPLRGRVWGNRAKGDTRALDKLHARAPLWLIGRLARLMLVWRLRGDHRRTPFFDVDKHGPVAVAHVLTDAERAAALDARDGVTS